jgi:hypothetical protein
MQIMLHNVRPFSLVLVADMSFHARLFFESILMIGPGDLAAQLT